MRPVHIVHVAKKTWQTVLEATGDESAPGIRRFPISGGWLYQVERHTAVDDIDVIARTEWSTPVFVPLHGDGL